MERGLPRYYAQESANATEFWFPQGKICDSQLCAPQERFLKK